MCMGTLVNMRAGFKSFHESTGWLTDKSVLKQCWHLGMSDNQARHPIEISTPF